MSSVALPHTFNLTTNLFSHITYTLCYKLLILNIMNTKFPYRCTVKETGRKFTPIMIDYDNEQVWWQQGQASGNGEWLDFRDVIFEKVETFVDLSEVEHI